MIGLYIYLSGVLIIWCVYAYIVFIKKEEVNYTIKTTDDVKEHTIRIPAISLI